MDSRECEKLDRGKRGKGKAFYELEEGEIRCNEIVGIESLIHRNMVVSAMKLSSSAQVAIEKKKVNRRQSTSPKRSSGQGGTPSTTVVQSKYSSLKGESDDVRQSTYHRKCGEKHRLSYSPSLRISSKERRVQREHYFSCYDYRHVLEKIEKVCSERLSKLLLRQNKDRKEFNILRKKKELEFIQEHICSYKIHFERVIPTVRYNRIKLPKLFVCMLRGIFKKHTQPQLMKFLRQQINDRNKEKRKKERWIFEASAGYLKKCFDRAPLTYSGFEMDNSKWRVLDYYEDEQQLKYLEMQSLTNVIIPIASSRELANEECDVFEPSVGILQLKLGINGGAENGLSVDEAEEIVIVDNVSLQYNDAPTTVFSKEVGMQATFSSPHQSEGRNMEMSCSSQTVIDEALELARAVVVRSDFRERQGCLSPGDEASEGSCSRSGRKFPHDATPNVHEAEASFHHEEPRAARMVEQADGVGSKNVSSGHTSCFAQLTEQQAIDVNSSTVTQPLTQQQHYDQTCQNDVRPYQPSGSIENTCSVRTRFDSPRTENVQQQSANQITTSSTVEHMPESGLQSDPFTIDTSRLLTSLGVPASFFAQVNEQRNVDANSSFTQHVTQQRYYEIGTHQYQPSGENNCPIRTWLDNPRASNIQRQSTNQTMAGSIYDQTMLESGFQSDPFTIELNQLLLLHDLITRRHLSERQKIILEREMEMAEMKRKFSELFLNLETETMQKKKEIEVLQEKICKHQILAETLQVLHQASAGVASCSQRGV